MSAANEEAPAAVHALVALDANDLPAARKFILAAITEHRDLTDSRDHHEARSADRRARLKEITAVIQRPE